MSDNIDITLPSGSNTWGTENNAALTKIAGHGHTGSGDGIKITAQSLDFSDSEDISLHNNRLTQVGSIDLTASGSAGAGVSIFNDGNTLKYKDQSGTTNTLFPAVTSSLAPIPNTFGIEDTSSNVTIQPSDDECYFGIGSLTARTITLPTAALVDAGRFYFFHDISGSLNVSHITILPSGTEKINLSSSFSLFGDTLVVRNEAGNGWYAARNSGAQLFNSMTSSFLASDSLDHIKALKRIQAQAGISITGSIVQAGSNANEFNGRVDFNEQVDFNQDVSFGTGIVGEVVFGSNVFFDDNVIVEDDMTVSGSTRIKSIESTGSHVFRSDQVLAGFTWLPSPFDTFSSGDWGNTNFIVMNTNSAITIKGLDGLNLPATHQGFEVTFLNPYNKGGDKTFTHSDAAATAGNKLFNPGLQSVVLKPGAMVKYRLDKDPNSPVFGWNCTGTTSGSF